MKTHHYMLFFLLIFLLSSCDKKIEIDEELSDKVISISVSYVNKFNSHTDTIPDAGTKLYVFHGISITDVSSYKYNIGDGVLSRANVPNISFDEVYLIPQAGEISVNLNQDMKKVLIAIESNYFKKEKLLVWISEDQLKHRNQTIVHKVFFNN